MSGFKWHYRGACHKLGHDVQHDGTMMAFEYVIRRVMDPAQLIPHLFETVDPDFHRRVRPGDLVVAGRNLGKGKAHVQGFIALQALGLGIACESMPYNTFRALVGQGVTFMSGCAGIHDLVSDGDEIEIDFASGEFVNHRSGVRKTYQPLPARIRETIELGGTKGMLRAWWQTRQAQPLTPDRT